MVRAASVSSGGRLLVPLIFTKSTLRSWTETCKLEIFDPHEFRKTKTFRVILCCVRWWFSSALRRLPWLHRPQHPRRGTWGLCVCARCGGAWHARGLAPGAGAGSCACVRHRGVPCPRGGVCTRRLGPARSIGARHQCVSPRSLLVWCPTLWAPSRPRGTRCCGAAQLAPLKDSRPSHRTWQADSLCIVESLPSSPHGPACRDLLTTVSPALRIFQRFIAFAAGDRCFVAFAAVTAVVRMIAG